ncbi:MAG TPA: ATP-binding protein [Burkholderiales bacterium]|jgi:two-component system sensor histidine kinase GlrK|nr:ATP-binding protein [Burkholderiales bacterium]
MRIYYPRSFLKLILAGFSLAVVPLVLALVYNAYSVNNLADHSQQTLYQAVQATQASRSLIEHVTAMERSVRQFVIVDEPSVLQGYALAHERFVDTAQRLSSYSLEEAQRATLRVLVDTENDLFQRVTEATILRDRAAEIVGAFANLSQTARELDNQGNLLVEREADIVQRMAGETQKFILWQMLALVPVAIFLVLGASLLIRRPISQIESAIQKLGEGEFGGKISVTGPADLQSLGRQLDWLRLRLLDLEEQKSRFLRHVSHELKTPLTALREGVELLSDEVTGRMTHGQLEIARILRQNTLRLQRLIEDLLAYHTAQFQTASLNPTPFRLKSLVERVVQQHTLALRAKNLSQSLAAADLEMEGDQRKIEAIIDNLLSNAIKYSPTGGTIRIQLRRRGGDVVIDFMDDGPGIPREDRVRVFEPFYQSSTEYTGPVKGTGLGLAIVREFALAHRGTVEVIDDGNPGAHLRVVLPSRQLDIAA